MQVDIRKVMVGMVLVLMVSASGACAEPEVFPSELAKTILGEVAIETLYVPEYGLVYTVRSADSSQPALGLQIAELHPELALYYYWSLPLSTSLPVHARVTVIFRTPLQQLQVTARHNWSRPKQFVFANMRDLTLRVGYNVRRPHESELHRAAAKFVAYGDRVLQEFDPNFRSWRRTYPKDDPAILIEAHQYAEIAVALHPDSAEAAQMMDRIENKLVAHVDFQKAATLMDEHERALRQVVGDEDEAAIDKHAKHLWDAYDLIVRVLESNPRHERAQDSLTRLGELLAPYPR